MKTRRAVVMDYLSLALLVVMVIVVGSMFLNSGLRGDIRAGWKTNFDKTSVDLNEIISGGVGKDGIPPIDAPRFESVPTAQSWLQPQSPVIALEINGEARAYPLAVLTRHEIVNDVVGAVPVAVTFCPLCNSALVYDRRVDGETLRFGVSGNLRHSDLIMWDDKTESWWQQFTGEAIVGDYVGTTLDLWPSQIVGFRVFAERYPNGQVLAGDSNATRRGSYNYNPYVGYDSDPSPFLFQGVPDSRLFPTSRVLAGLVNGQPIAYPFATLATQRVINDTVSGMAVVAFWQPGATSALDDADINASRDVGMAALYSRVLDGRELTFAVDDEGRIYDNQTSSEWNIFGEAIDGALVGSQLRQLNAFPHFWFAWAVFQPKTVIYGFEE